MKANYYGQPRELTAISCQQAARLGLNPPRPGYTIRIMPPIEYEQEGIDVEGIGFYHWPLGPREITEPLHGWYKYKSDAASRVEALAL